MKNFCIDCKKEISKWGKRCRSCANKIRNKDRKRLDLSNIMKKENHWNWKDGRTLKRYYDNNCLDCGIKIDWRAKRCGSCARSEDKNPCFIDGRSWEQYPSEFNNRLRNKIRKRDNYTCQNCTATQEEHFIVYIRDIEVHHIDYNRKNCKEENLITLCKKCNLKANYNRNYWYDKFRHSNKTFS